MIIGLETGLFVQRRVRLESHADALTGVLNRRGFISEAKRHIRRATRAGSAVSIALLDLDDFKMVNDAAGHAAGDDVLRTLASEWVSLSRPGDMVGRLGGDEFAMILPKTEAQDAMTVMRRLRAEATHPWSWGVTQLVAGDTVDAALARADAAMYDHKRNRAD